MTKNSLGLRLFAALAIVVCGVVNTASHVLAAPAIAAPGGLSLVQIKATGDEFVMLQNNTGATIVDLSEYSLMTYNNVSPLAPGVSSSSQQLPATSLGAGELLLLSARPMHTCGASVAGDLAVSFGDSSGFLQLVRTSLNSQGAVMQTPGDWVNWSSGANGMIQNMPSNTKNPRAVYYRFQDEISYAWQLADLDSSNSCQLNIVVVDGSGSSSAVTPLTLAATSPPATILGTANAASDSEAAMPFMPAGNLGLIAPQISEVLPNPLGTGNDNTDEFIEIYNPNDRPFELTGFALQMGMTTLRSYDFAAGTMLSPGSFTVFKSEEMKFSLSNTASQIDLLDPFGTIIGSTDAYAKAKDGITWALAKGKWYWTTEPTPGAGNIIKQPAAKASAKKSKSKTAKTTKRATAVNGMASTTSEGVAVAGGIEEMMHEAPIHVWVLALVAVGALLYGAYEYRRDLANRMFELRRKFGAGRMPWSTLGGRRGDRTRE